MDYTGNLNAESKQAALRLLEAEVKKEEGDEKKQKEVIRDTDRLLFLLEQEVPEAPFSLSTQLKNGDLNMTLSVKGAPLDPGTLEAFQTVKHLFHWEYKNEENIYTCSFYLFNTTWKSILFTWKYVKQHRTLLSFAVTCQMISAFLGVVAPIVSARIIRAYANNEAWRVMYIAVAILVIQLIPR